MSSYSFALIPLSSQIIIGPNLSPVKHTHTITLTCALLKVFLTYLRLSLSPGGRITHWRRGLTPIHMLDSSDQITFFQSSTVQSLYRCAHCNLLTTFSADSPGFSAATQLANPASDRRRRRVVMEIGNPTILVISLRGVELCCFKSRSIYRSSRSLVFRLYSRRGLRPWKVSNKYVASVCWMAF